MFDSILLYQLFDIIPLLNRYGDRIVAIKVLNCGNTSEERIVLESRFIREVTMMSKVKHENLVKVSMPQ